MISGSPDLRSRITAALLMCYFCENKGFAPTLTSVVMKRGVKHNTMSGEKQTGAIGRSLPLQLGHIFSLD